MATNTWDIPTMQPAAGLLGKDFKTFGFNSTWNGSGADSASASIAGRVLADKALMQQLGLTEADIQFKAGGYQNDNVIDDQFTLSDKARQALAGLTMSRTGVAGKKDGRSQVLRDAQGNVLSAGQAYTHDPAGDLKDAALKAAAVMGAAYGGGQLLGLEGGATAGAAGAAGGAASGGDWRSKTIGAITGGGGTGGSLLGGLFSGSSALRDILGLVGAGVQQYNLEKMAKDNREWASAEKAKERRRQMPVTGAGLLGKFRVIPSGAGNGG